MCHKNKIKIKSDSDSVSQWVRQVSGRYKQNKNQREIESKWVQSVWDAVSQMVSRPVLTS